MKIKSIKIDGFEDVYNMEVENHHNYFVNGGFILHNCDAIRYLTAGRPRPPRVIAPNTYNREKHLDVKQSNNDTGGLALW